jgi:hypothetical protein
VREARSQHGLELELENLALELLGALLRPALHVLELRLHGADHLLLFRELEPELPVDLVPRPLARGRKPGLDARLDREVELAFLVVELALPADDLGLGLLRVRELLLTDLEELRQLGQLAVAQVEVAGKALAGLFDSSAAMASSGRRTSSRGSEAPSNCSRVARRSRRGVERFGELDLVLAVRGHDGRFQKPWDPPRGW